MPNIYDVARLADVSIAAVSIVMRNPETKRVGAAKRARILKAASELGYRPSSIARALSEGSTKIIGLLIPMRQSIFANYFVAEVLSGVQACAAQNGYDLMIYSHLTENGRVTQRELSKSRYVDGMIVLNTRVSSKHDMDGTIHDLRATGLPFVMVNGYSGKEDINYVGVDDLRTGQMATEYLLRQGRKRLAALCGSRRSPISSQFLAGVRLGLKSQPRKAKDLLLGYSEYDTATTAQIVEDWFTLRQPPDAILAMDDHMVPVIYRAAARKGLRIGKNIAIVSRGNPAFAESLEPTLTTIAISGQEIGVQAASLLIQALDVESQSVQRIILTSTLIASASA